MLLLLVQSKESMSLLSNLKEQKERAVAYGVCDYRMEARKY